MSRAWPLAAALLGLAALACGYRIVGLAGADVSARTDTAPTRAQLQSQLAREPLRGEAFALLAQSGEASLPTWLVAARRAPRDLPTRAWLIDHYLVSGDYPAAFEQMEAVLRLRPPYGARLFPVMAQLAADPEFAAALAVRLGQGAPWRAGFLRSLERNAEPAAQDTVLAALQRHGGLGEEEFARWIERMIRDGRWGDAHARWAGTLDLSGGRLPAVFNGGFDTVPSGRGFDWRVARVPGVTLAFPAAPGGQGHQAHFSFAGRAVAEGGLSHPLVLAPGSYRLALRVRARGLRSAQGLEWTVACAGRAGVVAASPRLQGTFDWRGVEVDFTVPDAGCPGQWLRLRNPAPARSAQAVSGELWLDEVVVQAAPARPVPAPPGVDSLAVGRRSR